VSNRQPYHASVSDRRLTVIGILAILAASCSLADPTGSDAPPASGVPEDSECSPIDILAPSGTRVVLTGHWRSNDLGVYDIHQKGSCLYWLGMSQDISGEPGSGFANVFVGTVRNDFTIVGRWGDVPFLATAVTLSHGTMTLWIDFDQSGEVERPVLREVDMTGSFGGSVWVLEESLSAPTDLQGSLGGTVTGDSACPWIESNGERYELIGSGEWRIREAPLSVQTDDGRILARVGDPIQVRGRLSSELGSGCTEEAILVEELDPTP